MLDGTLLLFEPSAISVVFVAKELHCVIVVCTLSSSFTRALNCPEQKENCGWNCQSFGHWLWLVWYCLKSVALSTFVARLSFSKSLWALLEDHLERNSVLQWSTYPKWNNIHIGSYCSSIPWHLLLNRGRSEFVKGHESEMLLFQNSLFANFQASLGDCSELYWDIGKA